LGHVAFSFENLKPVLFPNNASGTDVMILKIFLPKNVAKKLACFAPTIASFCKNCDHNIGF
jgi:hypothetical protein